MLILLALRMVATYLPDKPPLSKFDPAWQVLQCCFGKGGMFAHAGWAKPSILAPVMGFEQEWAPFVIAQQPNVREEHNMPGWHNPGTPCSLVRPAAQGRRHATYLACYQPTSKACVTS